MPTADPYGRVIHFGIREHAMGAILNGIALDGLGQTRNLQAAQFQAACGRSGQLHRCIGCARLALVRLAEHRITKAGEGLTLRIARRQRTQTRQRGDAGHIHHRDLPGQPGHLTHLAEQQLGVFRHLHRRGRQDGHRNLRQRTRGGKHQRIGTTPDRFRRRDQAGIQLVCAGVVESRQFAQGEITRIERLAQSGDDGGDVELLEQPANEVENTCGDARVQAGRGFIEQDDTGIVREGPGNLDPLSHAARERPHEIIHPVKGDLSAREKLASSVPDASEAPPPRSREGVCDVSACTDVQRETFCRVLVHDRELVDAESPPLSGRQLKDVRAALIVGCEPDITCCRLDVACDTTKDGRLAGS
ncbi:MAG: hypothetical protein EBS32_02585 [Actinobacteria bacterium]|nr:hypothetical protein [Actinomycetota bacterium]